MLTLTAVIALVLSVSLVLGCAILRLSGIGHGGALAGPVGFTGLLVLAGLCVRLPGRASTCAVIVAVVSLVSLVYVVRTPGDSPVPLWTIATAAGAVLAAMIPFAAAGHVGLLGVGTNDDMAEHLLAAWTLQGHAPISSDTLIASGYPIGPHSIAAAVSAATGISLERTFTGLIVAVPALLAMAAAAAMPGALGTWQQVVLLDFDDRPPTRGSVAPWMLAADGPWRHSTAKTAPSGLPQQPFSALY